GPASLCGGVSPSTEVPQRAIVRRLGELLDGERGLAARAGRRIALLGLAFKANTDDVRQSPALSLARYLREAGARVVGARARAIEKALRADPELETADSVTEAVAGADAVLVATEWRDYAELDW